MQHKKSNLPKGFTLIEMMIVVAIVAILASVAVPSYLASIQRSNRAQAIATLLEASNWAQRSFTISNNYDGVTNAALSTAVLSQSPTTGTAKYTISVATSGTPTNAYTLKATPVGTVDKCGTFTLDETGKRDVTGNTATADDCWGGR